MAGVRWSTAELTAHYRRIGSPSPIADACGSEPVKRSKYGVDQSAAGKAARTADGIVFDSKVEMRHYATLKIAERAGFITGLELQPRFALQEKFTDAQGRRHRAIYYQADFSFVRDTKRIVVDVKGFPTQAWKLKEKMFLLRYPEFALEVWK